ncbi:MAG: hypothetical protein J0L97_04990 [Alphaproteobacteria bacterium]|nr:hypothetical protein [Alphaproteobacteria bacterium]
MIRIAALTFNGTTGADDLTGSSNADLMNGLAGADTLSGASGNDSVYGNQDNDFLYGNAGNDSIYGGQGIDIVFGGQDNDRIEGNLAADYLNGGFGDDTIYGGQGDDVILGSFGDDSLYGNLGDDELLADIGSDVLVGGGGQDRFTINLDSQNERDYIMDFDTGGFLGLGGDIIDLSAITDIADFSELRFESTTHTNLAGQSVESTIVYIEEGFFLFSDPQNILLVGVESEDLSFGNFRFASDGFFGSTDDYSMEDFFFLNS